MVELVLSSLVSLAAGGGFGWMFRSHRRKMSAEASASEISNLNMALGHIRELQKDNYEKNKLIRDLNKQNMLQVRRSHELEMELMSKRCDLLDCQRRRPPLPWQKTT